MAFRTGCSARWPCARCCFTLYHDRHHVEAWRGATSLYREAGL